MAHRVVVAHGGGHDDLGTPAILQTGAPLECTDRTERLFAVHHRHHDVEEDHIVEFTGAEGLGDHLNGLLAG